MKKIFFFLSLSLLAFFSLPTLAAAQDWAPKAPEGFMPLTWAKARGVASFYKPPKANGYLDYLTVIYLPHAQIKLIASTTPQTSWGPARTPFDVTGLPTVSNWVFPKMVTEQVKTLNPQAQFFWNMPYFNVNGATADLSLSLKSTLGDKPYITSGSRPENDITEARKMIIIDNAKQTAQVADFDAATFLATGDQAVESFAPTVTIKGEDSIIARVFVGVRAEGKELVIYCSRGATIQEAQRALLAAGVKLEHQLQVDGGASATCAYNLPGQYFVEPGRMLPHLMAAYPQLPTATVLHDGVNVRKGPGLNYGVAAKFNKGKIVVYEVKGDWVRVTESDWWVYKPLVKLD